MWTGDLEADGLLDDATRVWCGVFKHLPSGEIRKFGPDEIESKMLPFLDTVDTLCMHNGIGYDWPLLEKLYGYEYKGNKVDTLIMSRLLSPNRLRPFGMSGKGGPHSVEAWGYRLGRGKPEHEDWSKFSPEMLHRCTEDVEIQERIYNELCTEACDGDWDRAFKLCFKLFTILQRQEAYGWLVDQQQIDKSLSLLDHWVRKVDICLNPRLPKITVCLESKTKGVLNYVRKPFLKSGKPNQHVQKYWGDDADIVGGPHSRVSFRIVSLDKPGEVKDYLLQLGWIPDEWNVSKKTGERTSPKLSQDDPFIGVQGSMGKLVVKRVKALHRKGVILGWKERLRPDGRLPAKVTSMAVTGRAKHSEIVNVPKPDSFFGKMMRKIFTCPEGRVLIGCDAASCQDRMLADRAKSPEFTDMLLRGDKSKGTDSHSLAMKAVNKAVTPYKLSSINRGQGKGFNFGWKFGAQDPKLGKMAGGGKEVGGAIRRELEAVFPAQADLVKRLTDEWASNAKKVPTQWGHKLQDGWITGLDGRPIYIKSEHQILVYMLQSDEAICMAGAYCLLYTRLLKKGYKWGDDWAYVCWYHDEYTIECRKELAEDIKVEAEAAIADAGKFFGLTHCPQIGEAEVGANWYEIH